MHESQSVSCHGQALSWTPLEYGTEVLLLEHVIFCVLEKHRKKLGNACDVIQFQNCYYFGSHTLYKYCRVHIKL